MSFNGLKEEERCAAMEFVDKNDNLLKKSDSTIVFHFWYFGNGFFSMLPCDVLLIPKQWHESFMVKVFSEFDGDKAPSIFQTSFL